MDQTPMEVEQLLSVLCSEGLHVDVNSVPRIPATFQATTTDDAGTQAARLKQQSLDVYLAIQRRPT